MINKILVFGDSIAYGKWDSLGGWVAQLRKHIDEKYNIDNNGNVQLFNLSIPGELAPRLAERFENELKMRVDLDDECLVILAIGVNDCNPNNKRAGRQTDKRVFTSAFNKMIQAARQNKCAIICIGFCPVNPKRSKGALFTNKEVKKYDEYLTQVCEEEKIPKLELFDELFAENFPDKLFDAAHPSGEGHKILFEKIKSFLKSLHFID